MSPLPIFFNTRFDSKIDSLSVQTVALGDWFLTPVRYLFDGNKVEFSSADGNEKICFENEYNPARDDVDSEINFLKTVAFIILVAPAIILGTFIKALGYLSPFIRELHDRIINHLDNGPSRRASIVDSSDPLDTSKKEPKEKIEKEQESTSLSVHRKVQSQFKATISYQWRNFSKPFKLPFTITSAQLQFIQNLMKGDENPSADHLLLPPVAKTICRPQKRDENSVIVTVDNALTSKPILVVNLPQHNQIIIDIEELLRTNENSVAVTINDDLLAPKSNIVTRLNRAGTTKKNRAPQPSQIDFGMIFTAVRHNPQLLPLAHSCFLKFQQYGWADPKGDLALISQTGQLESCEESKAMQKIAKACDELRNQGQALLSTIASGHYQPVENEDIEITKQKINAIVWTLMFMAMDKKQEFQEGTFLLLDPNRHFYNFMRTIGGYERISSHYVGRTLGPKQWGFDLNGLPKEKRTILFDLVDAGTEKQALFLKPENYGFFHITQIALHCYEWGWAIVNKFISGADDIDIYRKERVPAVELALFKQIIAITENWGTRATVDKQARLHGLSYMHQYLSNLDLSKAEETLLTLVENLKKELALPKYDLLQYRSGREVIFLPKDFIMNDSAAL